jgi:hypothetical protein
MSDYIKTIQDKQHFFRRQLFNFLVLLAADWQKFY